MGPRSHVRSRRYRLSSHSPTTKRMKTKHLKLVTLALLPGFFVLLSACTTSVPGEQHTAVAKTATSTTFTDTFQATARVSAIDAATRSLTLALENGKQTTIKC